MAYQNKKRERQKNAPLATDSGIILDNVTKNFPKYDRDGNTFSKEL